VDYGIAKVLSWLVGGLEDKILLAVVNSAVCEGFVFQEGAVKRSSIGWMRRR
jgi:hypothetical protein